MGKLIIKFKEYIYDKKIETSIDINEEMNLKKPLIKLEDEIIYQKKEISLFNNKFNIVLEKDLNEIIFKELERRYKFDYEIIREFVK